MDEYLSRTTAIKTALTVALTLIVWPLFSLLIAWPFQLLWNWVMPLLFALPTITFWQAVGLLLLTSILLRWKVVVSECGVTIG